MFAYKHVISTHSGNSLADLNFQSSKYHREVSDKDTELKFSIFPFVSSYSGLCRGGWGTDVLGHPVYTRKKSWLIVI